jgi:signal transduction histidine kinase
MGDSPDDVIVRLLRGRRDALVEAWVEAARAVSTRYATVPVVEMSKNLGRLFDAMMERLETGDDSELKSVIETVTSARAASGFAPSDTLPVIDVGLETVIGSISEELSNMDDCCSDLLRIVSLFSSVSTAHAVAFEEMRKSDYAVGLIREVSEAIQKVDEASLAKGVIQSVSGRTDLEVAVLIPSDGEEVFALAPERSTLPRDILRSLCADVLDKGETVVAEIPEMVDEKNAPEAAVGRKAVGVPMKSRGATVGALLAVAPEGRTMPDHEVRLLSAAADQIGAACDNVRMRRSLLKSLSDLRLDYSFLFSVLEGMDALVYVADMDTYEVLMVNQRMREMFGSDLVGRICYEALQVGQDAPCPFCTNDRIVADGRPTRPYVWKFQNTVTGRWFRCIDRAIAWPDGRFVRMEVAFDITDAELASRKTEEAADVMRLYNDLMVHDLGNYAGTIRGFLDLLLEGGELTDGQLGLVRHAHAQVAKCQQMLDNISLYGRLSDEEGDISGSVDLRDLLDEAVREARTLMAGPAVPISKSYTDEPREVSAGTFARNIFSNLLSNAVKFGEGKEVVLDIDEAELDGRAAWRVSVSDSGRGIPPDKRDEIVERYTRLATTFPKKGKGLGLHIAHSLTKRYRGTLEISDRVPGDHTKGTRVSVTLPRA